MTEKRYNVLFLCTGNSARSIMAEAILNSDNSGKFKGFSAGSAPRGQVEPDVLALLTRGHYATNGLRSKSWDEFAAADAPKLDFVFTLSDELIGADLPAFNGEPMRAHWGVPDPLSFVGSPVDKALFCADVMRVLHNRLDIFCALPIRSLALLTLQEQLDGIGNVSEENVARSA